MKVVKHFRLKMSKVTSLSNLLTFNIHHVPWCKTWCNCCSCWPIWMWKVYLHSTGWTVLWWYRWLNWVRRSTSQWTKSPVAQTTNWIRPARTNSIQSNNRWKYHLRYWWVKFSCRSRSSLGWIHFETRPWSDRYQRKNCFYF